MARACTVCTHPERARLELGLARHVPMKTLEQRFRTPEHPLSVAALSRHRVGHMPDRLKAQLKLGQKDTEIDLDALRNSESEGLLQHLVGQRGRLYYLCDRAEQVDDLRAASSLHGRIIDNLSLTAKLLGELGHNHQTTVNNLIVSPEYLTLRSRLIEALRQFPEARRAVAAILRDLEERPEEPAPVLIEARPH